MSKAKSVLALISAAALTFALGGPASAFPPLPSSFYGEVHISDTPPGVGDQADEHATQEEGDAGDGNVIEADLVEIHLAPITLQGNF